MVEVVVDDEAVEDIEAEEVFRVEAETPRMGTGFALIRHVEI